jgi:flavin reductase (DIM6/NTAB) family NADH-FMN oxidoreductase RutF
MELLGLDISENIEAYIEGDHYPVNRAETHVYFLGELTEMHEDMEGDTYILFEGKAIHIYITEV